MARFDPTLFVRQVRQEVGKVTWPTRKETLVTTGLVFAFVTIAAIFFTVVDWIIGIAVRSIFGFGS
jgi:preprotein translocase subunit SecE